MTLQRRILKLEKELSPKTRCSQIVLWLPDTPEPRTTGRQVIVRMLPGDKTL
jgi:hypothetical protein